MYHTQEVIGLNTDVRVNSPSEAVVNSSDESSFHKIRFGELSIGDKFVFHDENLVKTGEYSATHDRLRNRSYFLFFKKDLVTVKDSDEVSLPFDFSSDPKSTKLIESFIESLDDSSTSTTAPPRPLFSNYTIETGDQLHIYWKCLALLSGVATVDVFLETAHNGTYELFKDKDIRSYSGSWCVPIPDLRFLRGTLTGNSVTLTHDYVLLKTDQFSQMFEKKINPGDTCIIMLQNVYGEPPFYSNKA